MKFKKLGALILGAILTVGIAAGVGLNSEGQRVDAASETTVTMTKFTATSASMDGYISYSTAKGGGTSNPAINSGVIRLYQNSAGTGGGTITITANNNATLSSVTIGSSMKTSIAYTIGSSTTKSATESLAANGKTTTNSINNTSITYYCMGTSSSTRLYVNYLSVTYSVPTPSATLESLSISGELDKTEYYIGESWDTSGLTVIGTYSDKSTSELTPDEWNFSPTTPTLGTESVAIKAIIGEIESDPVSFDVTVIEPEKYELVTNVNSLHEGMKVAIGATYNETSYALSTTQNNNNRAAVEATISDNEMVISSDIQVFTLEAGTVEGTYAFNTGSGYIHAASSGSNYLRTQTTNDANSSWEIDINGGIASIISKGDYTRNDLRFNNSNKIFSAYESTSTMIEVSIYSEPIEKIYPTSISVNDINIPQGDSAFIDFNVEPANAIIENDSYESDNENITIENRSIKCNSTAEIGSVATITATVQGQEGLLSTEFKVTVVEPRVLSLSFSNYTNFIVGQTLSDIENGTLTAKTTSGEKVLTLDDVTITLDDEEITSDREFTLEDNGKKIKFTYLSVSTNSYAITVTENTTEDPEVPVSGETTVKVVIGDYATANGWANSTKYTPIELDENITATANGGDNTGKYYTSGNAWRFYQSENATMTISAKEGYGIVSITVEYTSDKTGCFLEAASGETVYPMGDAFTYTVGNTGSATNGQARVTSISVTYRAYDAEYVASRIKVLAGGWENFIEVTTPNCADNYSTANELVLALSETELKTFKESPDDTEIGKARKTYEHWCVVNGVTPYTPQTPVGSNLIAFDNQNYLIIFIALAALSAFAFVYVAKRKQRKIEL